MTRIDFHAHLLPQAYIDLLPEGSLFPAPSPTKGELDEMMRRCDTDAAVLSVSPPGAHFGDGGLEVEIARAANEGLAQLVAAEPTRYAALATLPVMDLAAALDEVAYSLDVLKLDGVMLLSNVAGTYLGDPAWEPLYAELSKRWAHVFLHPSFAPYPPPLAAVHPIWMYEFPFETTRAVCNLIYSGTADRCPGIRWQLAHMGGDVPFLAHRLASLAERESAGAAANLAAPFLEYLKDFYYDTGLSNNRPALAATLEVASISRVVFGTDWPYCALPDADPFPGLAGLTPDERRLVDAVNGADLVPRLTDAVAAAAGGPTTD
jgi:6-methylsalicylate decarboxylase